MIEAVDLALSLRELKDTLINVISILLSFNGYVVVLNPEFRIISNVAFPLI